jgi:hypothetical protein
VTISVWKLGGGYGARGISFWKPTVLDVNMIHSFNMTLELHVPCRDPLEHLMSMCNMHRRSFDCEASNLEHEFLLCANREWQNCFSIEMLNLSYTSVKRFNPISVEPYIEHISTLLQRRRVTHDYKYKSMKRNRPRSIHRMHLEQHWRSRKSLAIDERKRVLQVV